MILRKKDTDNIIALFAYKNNIKLVYTNCYKKRYYLILADFIIDYEKQVLFISIKINMVYSIYYIPSKKRELII